MKIKKTLVLLMLTMMAGLAGSCGTVPEGKTDGSSETASEPASEGKPDGSSETASESVPEGKTDGSSETASESASAGKPVGNSETDSGAGADADDTEVREDAVCREKDPEGHFLKADGSFFRNEAVYFEDGWYFTDGEGKPAGGVHRMDGVLYLFDGSGRRVEDKGWQVYDNKKYYVSESGSLMRNGKKWIDGRYYIFNSLGELRTGRIDADENSFYYSGSDGALLTDFDFTLDNIRYHADTDGRIYTGTMYEKAQEYSSSTDYLILVNLATQKTAVYQGEKGNWRLLREMLCSTGAPINPTPKGEYATTTHVENFVNHGMRAWYGTGFIGGLYLFHSSPYEIAPEPLVCVEPELGVAASHGCVRLALEDAKWMYDTLPLSTKVVIYEE